MKELTETRDMVTSGVKSLNAMEVLAIMQDRNPKPEELRMAKERLKQLKKTPEGRESLKDARKNLELDVKANMMDGGMVMPKKKKKAKAKKMMGGGKVYSRGSRKANYSG
jgi:type III secretory pathway component EscU